MPVQLHSERLTLRPFRPADLDRVATISCNEEKMRFIGPPLTRHQAKEALDWKLHEWRRRGFGWFAILEKKSKQFIGEVGLQAFEYDTQAKTVELAYIIAQPAQHKGYATEAAREVLRFGFIQKQLTKIVAVIDPENIASQRTLARLGFQFRDQRMAYGRPVMYYEITREAFMDYA